MTFRVAIAGIHQEGTTFSEATVGTEFFDIARGEALLARFDLTPYDDVEWIPIMGALGGASGPVRGDAFDAMLEETVTALRAAGPLGGIFLDMHGAFVVESRLGAEEAYLRGIRAVVGPDVVISMSMDPHGSMSRELAQLSDLAGCHRHAPHIDNRQTRERAIRNLVEVLRSGAKPMKIWAAVPLVLPGERTSTVVEPAKSLFARLAPATEREGVLDVNIWLGFPWADDPRNHATVMATGSDEQALRDVVTEFARDLWAAREDFEIVAPHVGDWNAAMEFMLGDHPRPIYVSDSGDNLTAGSSSDVTLGLNATMANPAIVESGLQILFAALHDPGSLDAAIEAGVGATLHRGVGASVDDRYSPPAVSDWVVDEIVDGTEGEGIVAALLRSGRITVAVQRFRYRFVGAGDIAKPLFGARGAAFFDSSRFDVVVVKNGYLFPSQAETAASWFFAITPGGTNMDVKSLSWKQRASPLFPFETDFTPSLEPEVVL